MKPKLQIEKKYLADIQFIRKLIEHNHRYQDLLVDRIAKKMGIYDTTQAEILWDHIYNESSWTVEIVEDKS